MNEPFGVFYRGCTTCGGTIEVRQFGGHLLMTSMSCLCLDRGNQWMMDLQTGRITDLRVLQVSRVGVAKLKYAPSRDDARYAEPLRAGRLLHLED